MTTVRLGPSGPKVEIEAGEAPFSARYAPAAQLPLDEGTTSLIDTVIPLPADAPGPRLALVTIVLAMVNTVGFDAAPFVVPVGMTRGAELFAMGFARSTPTGPGVAGTGAPFYWTVVNAITVQPGDEFTVFASSVDAAGGVGGAATVVPSPSPQDAGTVVTFFFP